MIEHAFLGQSQYEAGGIIQPDVLLASTLGPPAPCPLHYQP